METSEFSLFPTGQVILPFKPSLPYGAVAFFYTNIGSFVKSRQSNSVADQATYSPADNNPLTWMLFSFWIL